MDQRQIGECGRQARVLYDGTVQGYFAGNFVFRRIIQKMLQAPLKISPGIMLAIGPAQKFILFGDPNGLRRVGDKAVRDGIRELPQRRARTGLPPNPDMMAAVGIDQAQDHVDLVPAPGKTAAQGKTAVPAPGVVPFAARDVSAWNSMQDNRRKRVSFSTMSSAIIRPSGVSHALGVGTAHELEKGHYYWVGEFSGAFFNDAGAGSTMHNSGVKCPGYNDLDFNNKKNIAAGHCIIMDRDGDKAHASWQCAGDTYKCQGTITWTSGTGKYAKISGSMPFTGVTEVSHADGKASGWATWNR